MQKKMNYILFVLVFSGLSLRAEAETTQLFSALRVVPISYGIKVEKGVRLDTPVTISGVGDWEQQLDGALSSAGLDYTADNCSNEVQIYRKKPVLALTNVAPIVVEPKPGITTQSAISTPVAAKILVPKIVPAVQRWALTAGNPLSKELAKWGDASGWKVVWNVEKDWLVPADSVFIGADFQIAASKVIQSLAKNGAIIRSQFYLANKTMVVTGAPE